MSQTNYSPTLLRQFVIGEKWSKMSFEDVNGLQEEREFLDQYKDGHRWVMLRGENGCGKTMMMNLYFIEFLKMRKTSYVVYFPRLIELFKAGWGGDSRFQALVNADFLGIDDVGKGFMMEGGASKELVVACLDYTLRVRYDNGKPTWMTTNLKMGDFKTLYSPSIASLIKRSFDVLLFDHPDYYDGRYKVQGK